MNLVWHIIKKDLRRVSWVLVVWAVTGGYLLIYRKFDIVQRSAWDNLGIISLITFGALTLALIAAIVQEDGLTEGNEFWHTRPIAAGRMLAAKLGLILPLFILIPAVVTLSQSWFYGTRVSGSEVSYSMLMMGIIVLACAAMAACTKDLGRYFLGGILCIMGGVTLAEWMVSWFDFEPMTKTEQMRIVISKMYATFGLCGVASVAMLANQYFTRRTVVSIGIAFAAVVGIALIGSLWRWSFFG